MMSPNYCCAKDAVENRQVPEELNQLDKVCSVLREAFTALEKRLGCLIENTPTGKCTPESEKEPGVRPLAGKLWSIRQSLGWLLLDIERCEREVQL